MMQCAKQVTNSLRGINISRLFGSNFLRNVSTKRKIQLSDDEEERIMKENWKLRCDLATAYRAFERYGLNEGVDNHLTAKAPSLYRNEPIVLIIPYGYYWSEVTPECLVGIDSKTFELVEGYEEPDPTAYGIHLGVYQNRPDVNSVMHTHAKYSAALSCLEDSEIKMVHQNSGRFYNNVAYDLSLELIAEPSKNNEGDRIGKALGDKTVLVMGNHGLVTAGRNVAVAFDWHYYFERAAQIQLLAYQTGKPLRSLSDDAARHVGEDWDWSQFAEAHLYGIQKALKRQDPNFINEKNLNYMNYC